jgi:hypothetical protein
MVWLLWGVIHRIVAINRLYVFCRRFVIANNVSEMYQQCMYSTCTCLIDSFAGT